MDKKRVNEFGFGGEDADQRLAATDASAAPQDGDSRTEDNKKTNWVVLWLLFHVLEFRNLRLAISAEQFDFMAELDKR